MIVHRIFVRNINYDATPEEFRAFVAAIGPILDLRLPIDRESGKLRGIAFADFSSEADAEAMIDALNKKRFRRRRLFAELELEER